MAATVWETMQAAARKRTILAFLTALAIVSAVWQGRRAVHSKVESEPSAPASAGGVWIEPALGRSAPFPETLRTASSGNERTLQLTGSFVRRRPILFVLFDVYEIASYVEKPTSGSTQELLDNMLVADQRRVYLLRFLRSLTGAQIKEAMSAEVETSFGDVDMTTHGADVDRFVNLMAGGVAAGDSVYLLWTPDGCLYAGFKRCHDLERITAEPTVARAIWRIWAGPTAEPGRAGLVAKYRTDG